MFDALNQPYVALCFITGGIFWYVLYEIFFMIRTIFPFRIIEFITDFLAVCCGGGLFILVSSFSNDGRILFYEVLCFFVGFFIMRLILKNTLRKQFLKAGEKLKKIFTEKIKKMNIYFQAVHNKNRRRKYERKKIRELRLRQQRQCNEKQIRKRMLLSDRVRLRSGNVCRNREQRKNGKMHLCGQGRKCVLRTKG